MIYLFLTFYCENFFFYTRRIYFVKILYFLINKVVNFQSKPKNFLYISRRTPPHKLWVVEPLAKEDAHEHEKKNPRN